MVAGLLNNNYSNPNSLFKILVPSARAFIFAFATCLEKVTKPQFVHPKIFLGSAYLVASLKILATCSGVSIFLYLHQLRQLKFFFLLIKKLSP